MLKASYNTKYLAAALAGSFVTMLVIAGLFVFTGGFLNAQERPSRSTKSTPPPFEEEHAAWYGSFWQDGIAPGQYTFVSINNTGSNEQRVTLSFYDNEGSVVAEKEKQLAAGAQWIVHSETRGGLAGTAENSGYMKVTSSGTLSDLQPWSTVVIPNDGNLPGFTASWDLK